MSKYRVEKSSSNRAGCQDTVCKSNAVKILKGELRFAVWVETPQFQSFKYKHWGCVSGFQIENMREDLATGTPGEYNWELLDGLTDLPPDMMDKVKTAIVEGKIADEDFKGDPEYNKLGAKGIRGRTQKPKPAEDEEGEQAAESADKPAPKKRGRAKKDEDEDADQEDTKPAKKRTKKSAKQAVKDEEDSEEEVVAPVIKRAKGKRGAQKEEADDDAGVKELLSNVIDTPDTGADTKSSVKRSRSKKAAKNDAHEHGDVKMEDIEPFRMQDVETGDPSGTKLENDEAKVAVKKRGKGVKKVGNKNTLPDGEVKMEDIEPFQAESVEIGELSEAKLEGDEVKSAVKKPRGIGAKKTGKKGSLPGGEVKMEDIEPYKADGVEVEEPTEAKIEDTETKPASKKSGIKATKRESSKKEDVHEAKSTFNKEVNDDLSTEGENEVKAPIRKASRKGKKPVMAAAASSSRPRRTKST